MRITQEADYAFRIIRTLASCDSDRIGSSIISEDAGIPHRFTFKILRKLTHAGITKSIRGKGGGYKLNKEPKDITLLDIIEIIDGPVRINKCLEPDYNCTMHPNNDCAIHVKIAEISEKLRVDLGAVDFSQFI